MGIGNIGLSDAVGKFFEGGRLRQQKRRTDLMTELERKIGEANLANLEQGQQQWDDYVSMLNTEGPMQPGQSNYLQALKSKYGYKEPTRYVQVPGVGGVPENTAHQWNQLNPSMSTRNTGPTFKYTTPEGVDVSVQGDYGQASQLWGQTGVAPQKDTGQIPRGPGGLTWSQAQQMAMKQLGKDVDWMAIALLPEEERGPAIAQAMQGVDEKQLIQKAREMYYYNPATQRTEFPSQFPGQPAGDKNAPASWPAPSPDVNGQLMTQYRIDFQAIINKLKALGVSQDIIDQRMEKYKNKYGR